MNRLKQAWLALCVAALAGCAEPPGIADTQLVCATDGRETYRSTVEVCWKSYRDNRWANCGWTKEFRQSAFESCHTETVVEGKRK